MRKMGLKIQNPGSKILCKIVFWNKQTAEERADYMEPSVQVKGQFVWLKNLAK